MKTTATGSANWIVRGRGVSLLDGLVEEVTGEVFGLTTDGVALAAAEQAASKAASDIC